MEDVTVEHRMIARPEMVEAGESEYSDPLILRSLLKNRHAQNALASKNAVNWNVAGTRILRHSHPLCHEIRSLSGSLSARSSSSSSRLQKRSHRIQFLPLRPQKPKEEPIEENDYFMEAIRYAIYDHARQSGKPMPKPTTGLVKPIPGMLE